MAWTRFMDMHSGGCCKETPYEYIYIEAPEQEAKVIFYNKFGHNPERVTCTCCGDDYSISEVNSHVDVNEYEKRDGVGKTLIIAKDEIKEEWRRGYLPKQGYVWID